MIQDQQETHLLTLSEGPQRENIRDLRALNEAEESGLRVSKRKDHLVAKDTPAALN